MVSVDQLMKMLGVWYPLLMKPGLPTVYNCPQFTKQSVGGGNRFFGQMRVISTIITKQISSFK